MSDTRPLEGRFTVDDLVALDRATVVARLLAGVVHEINNALLVISGTAEMLEDHPASPDALSQGLTRIRSRSARAAAAITEVQGFARGRPGERGSVNLREIASRATGLRTFSAGRAGLAITCAAPEHSRFIVLGSQVLLLQAILDLVANAEQALAGTPGGDIRVTLADEQGRAIVRVADNGPGVPLEHRARIFEPFFTTRDRNEATGLGLAAARRIAELHDGTLTLEEETPAGASFALSLPLSRRIS